MKKSAINYITRVVILSYVLLLAITASHYHHYSYGLTPSLTETSGALHHSAHSVFTSDLNCHIFQVYQNGFTDHLVEINTGRTDRLSFVPPLISVNTLFNHYLRLDLLRGPPLS
ncbi:MAG: hypothetical protein HUU54_17420 [Ignavibacteriaceae bacterium]|nr:hypothetical protein [Ignavibacteriaceae bacterium]